MINKDLYTHDVSIPKTVNQRTVQNTIDWFILALILGSVLFIIYFWYLVFCYVLVW